MNMLSKVQGKCNVCEKSEVSMDLFAHHYNDVCPQQCPKCRAKLVRSTVAAHPAVCKEEVIVCCAADLGCNFSGKRKSMPKHEKACKYVWMKPQITPLKEENRKLNRELVDKTTNDCGTCKKLFLAQNNDKCVVQIHQTNPLKIGGYLCCGQSEPDAVGCVTIEFDSHSQRNKLSHCKTCKLDYYEAAAGAKTVSFRNLQAKEFFNGEKSMRCSLQWHFSHCSDACKRNYPAGCIELFSCNMHSKNGVKWAPYQCCGKSVYFYCSVCQWNAANAVYDQNGRLIGSEDKKDRLLLLQNFGNPNKRIKL
jgi:hypothetical protein